ncbi:hypothetical protein HK102_007815 [Quaeritorhiza haematococci]|nr:hypothetical protein HK102_007815 [Quaeritorhiza haematococci]
MATTRSYKLGRHAGLMAYQHIARRSTRRYATTASSTVSPTPYFPTEPPRPIMKTPVPGPRSKALLSELDPIQDTRAVFFMSDTPQSIGNYIADADGNILLDMYCQIASLSVGYNNPRLLKAAMSEQWASYVVNRPALGVVPPAEWPKMLKESLLKVAPKGLDNCFTAMCGSCANEIAFKAAFMYHQRKKRGHDVLEFTEEELSSCMDNRPPGSPELAILSFKSGFHGRMFGSLSTTRSKAIHKVDIPAHSNWPAAPFPKLKYPLEEFAAENKEEEARCLQEVESILKDRNSGAPGKVPVVAMIVEPIQSEGGDNHASAGYFRSLQRIAEENDVLFIVDEVQTGVGVTGKFWAHEHWDLPTPPDMVTFSKKLQAAGFFHNFSTRPAQAFRNFNTWMGDPIRALLAQSIIREIESLNLLENVQEVGSYLQRELQKISSADSTGLVQNVRGVGTFLAFDSTTGGERDALLYEMRQRGVHMAGCGDRAVRFRPMLVFQKHHADVFLDILEGSLKKVGGASS